MTETAPAGAAVPSLFFGPSIVESVISAVTLLAMSLVTTAAPIAPPPLFCS